MKKKTLAVALAIFFVGSTLQTMLPNSQFLLHGEDSRNSISSEMQNDSSLELFSSGGEWSRGYVHNWTDSDGFILIGIQDLLDLDLYLIEKNGTIMQLSLPGYSDYNYYIHSLQVDSEGEITIGRRVSVSNSCGDRYDLLSIYKSNLTINPNTVQYGYEGLDNCGGVLSRLTKNGVEIEGVSWQSSTWADGCCQGRKITIGNYTFSHTNTNFQSALQLRWDNVLIANSTLAFYQKGQGLAAINPDSGSELWSIEYATPSAILYDSETQAVLACEGGGITSSYHASNGTQDNSLINFVNTEIASCNYKEIQSLNSNLRYFSSSTWDYNYSNNQTLILNAETNQTIGALNGSIVASFPNGLSFLYLDTSSSQVQIITPDGDDDGVISQAIIDSFVLPGVVGDNCENSTTGSVDSDSDGCFDSEDEDDDNDGWLDEDELNCGSDPLDSDSRPSDLDDDGVCNLLDSDDDGDGFDDSVDMFPHDANEWNDNDMDGIGDNSDDDDDNDGYLDNVEIGCQSNPLDNSSVPLDTDEDGYCNPMDPDDDNDGFLDSDDPCPLDYTEWLDTDGDGICDNSDTDSDNDGVSNENDSWPLDPCAQFDTDSDGKADNIVNGCQTNLIEDADDDNDGLADQNDFCPAGETDWLSGTVTDGDGDGCRDDGEDEDDDNDGVADILDQCPRGYVGWSISESDWDSDGCHDLFEDTDDDDDGIDDESDSCPLSPMGSVIDSTGCSVDTDNDGYPDGIDAFPNDPSEWSDTDGDGVGNNKDVFPEDSSEWSDYDEDGIGDNADSCSSVFGSSTIPLGCPDIDGDGYGGEYDLFPYNASEWSDSDYDGVGDNADVFPYDPSEWSDIDNDGIGDNSDIEINATSSNDVQFTLVLIIFGAVIIIQIVSKLLTV